VLYDTLLDQNTPGEVEAVLAHELGHWKFWHPTRLLIIAQGNLLWTLGLFAVFIHNKSLFASFGFDPRLAVESPVGGPQPILIGFMLYQLLFEPLDTFVKFVINTKTRKYEYQAGELAYLMCANLQTSLPCASATPRSLAVRSSSCTSRTSRPRTATSSSPSTTTRTRPCRSACAR
jgi:Zn-dependent protease with chaperone function